MYRKLDEKKLSAQAPQTLNAGDCQCVCGESQMSEDAGTTKPTRSTNQIRVDLTPGDPKPTP
jgi:hypothetical protein